MKMRFVLDSHHGIAELLPETRHTPREVLPNGLSADELADCEKPIWISGTQLVVTTILQHLRTSYNLSVQLIKVYIYIHVYVGIYWNILESPYLYLGIWLWVFEDRHTCDWDAPRVESSAAMVDLQQMSLPLVDYIKRTISSCWLLLIKLAATTWWWK